MAGCCGCISALKPRYKRLVDDIFPVNPEDGLVKNNMDKLTFYAITSPEKLDRIGQYLEQRLSRDISHHRLGFVVIAMDALDQLLVSCHSHSLNLFVESFLKMVQKLLECDEPDLQVLATQSFVKFANIEEDNPSYHRRYDFFICKFGEMCHNGNNDEIFRIKVRIAGLRGIQGIVRKTITDDLQVNIWETVHMDKIIPSILYNMHSPDFMSVELESPNEEHPAYIAETVFRDLICRASYGNIKSVLRPILMHLDNHKLWVPNEFAIKCFKIIMYSVQQQYGYLVIQMLMSHLDKHMKSDPNIKTSIINVLYESVIISAGGSIGPSVLDVFNSLLRHLRISVDNKSEDETKRDKEKRFEEAIINTIGEFANNLPDYQKIEIMMFIMGKFPQFGNEDLGFSTSMDTQLQTMLLKTLLKVATKYKTITMANTFPPEFLQPLLRISLLEDPSMRRIVQEILHTLIDRHENTQKLLKITIPKDISHLDLMIEKVQRQDSMFMKKNSLQFYWSILENVMMESNKVDNFEAVYCTMCLISIEMGGDDILLELLRLGLDVQHIATSDNHLPMTHQCAIHGLVAAFLNMVSQLMSLPPLCQYVSEVIEIRKREAKHLLPDFAFNRSNRPTSYPQCAVVKDAWLFEQSILQEFLRDCGQDASRLSGSFHQKPHSAMGLKPGDDFALGGSASDLGSINLDMESVESSPHMPRKNTDEITVESLKRMLAEDNSEKREEEDKRRLEILETFRTAPFEEIVARSEAKSNHFHNKLNEILDMVSRPPESPEQTRKTLEENSGPVFEMQFPDLFVY